MEGNQFAVILTTIKEDQNDTRRISLVIWYRKYLATHPLLESTTQNHLGAPGAKELITTFPNSASSHAVQGNISLATMLKIWWGGQKRIQKYHANALKIHKETWLQIYLPSKGNYMVRITISESTSPPYSFTSYSQETFFTGSGV